MSYHVAPKGAARSRGAVVGSGRTAVIYEWGPDAVVKLFRSEMPALVAKSEAAIAAAVSAAGAQAPRFLGTVEIEGRIGILYERLRGPAMPERFMRRPWTLDGLVRSFALLHVRMHGQHVSGLPGVRERLARAIDRASAILGDPAHKAASERLARLSDGLALCHGDLHPANVLLTERGPIAIDWDSAAIGPAAADVVRTEFLLLEADVGETSPLPRPVMGLIRRRLRSVYLREYLKRSPIPAAELRAWRFPVLAARLAEGIEDERSMLLRKIEFELREA